MFFSSKYRILKRMNYMADQKGIMERFMRETDGWNVHLENTKNAIINSAQNKVKNTCAILGSGWLLDIPMDFLLANFNKIYLFDVLHPTQIKQKWQKEKKVVFVELDVTGDAINQFYNAVQMFKGHKVVTPITDFVFEGFKNKENFDYVVSANILNQLDILLVDYLQKYPIYSTDQLLQLRKTIQQKHIDSLPVGKTCLITDYEELVYSTTGQLEQSRALIHINLSQFKKPNNWQWQWQFDNNQNYIPGKNVVFNVMTIEL